LKYCFAEHYQVVSKLVFVRDKCSTLSKQLNVLPRGAVLCTQSSPPASSRTVEGPWIHCPGTALLWKDQERATACPLAGGNPSFLLKTHNSYGLLLQLFENPYVAAQLQGWKPCPPTLEEGIRSQPLMPTRFVGPEERERALSLSGLATEAEPLPGNLAELDHWIVETTESCGIFKEARDGSSPLFALKLNDIVVLGKQPPDLRVKGMRHVLYMDADAKIYRQGFRVYQGGTPGCIVVQCEQVPYLRQAAAANTSGTVLRTLSGFGEPWVVEHDQVMVRRGPSQGEALLGTLLKGDVLGVEHCKGNWVKLARDSNVRMKSLNRDTAEPFFAVNTIQTRKLEPVREGDKFFYHCYTGPPSKLQATVGELWMMVQHQELGALLRQRAAPEATGRRKGGASLEPGCALSDERSRLYRDVVNLCHKRIYEENLDSLWEGEREKLPTSQSLEAKLFDRHTTVMHVAVNRRCVGGAILKEHAVLAHTGSGGANVAAAATEQSHQVPGRATVSYIDSCAAEPGSHAGTVIWGHLREMRHILCIACHPILLPETVHFWASCGMRRYDPEKAEDCQEFAAAVLMRTHGTVACRLEDVAKALPPSKLPLYIWISRGVGEFFGDSLFVADGEDESPEPST